MLSVAGILSLSTKVISVFQNNPDLLQLASVLLQSGSSHGVHNHSWGEMLRGSLQRWWRTLSIASVTTFSQSQKTLERLTLLVCSQQKTQQATSFIGLTTQFRSGWGLIKTLQIGSGRSTVKGSSQSLPTWIPLLTIYCAWYLINAEDVLRGDAAVEKQDYNAPLLRRKFFVYIHLNLYILFKFSLDKKLWQNG